MTKPAVISKIAVTQTLTPSDCEVYRMTWQSFLSELQYDKNVKVITPSTQTQNTNRICSTCLGPHQANHINQLEKIQKMTARYILRKPATKSPNQDSVTQMMRDLELVTFVCRRKLARCTVIF